MSNQAKFLAQAAKIANVILVGAGVASLLAFSYLLISYGFGQKQFAGQTGAVLYYGVPIVLAVSFFASLRLKPVHKINLVILSMSFAFTVYGLEAFLYFSRPEFFEPHKPLLNLDSPLVTKKKRQQVKEFVKKEFGVEVDTRDRIEIIEDLRRQGIDAVPSFIPRWLLKPEYDEGQIAALGGIANKVTVLCNENGSYVTYDSDEHGFHNPAGIWSLGSVDIAALGDSYTQGYCVPSDKNFVALIRGRRPATLNLGMAGEGPLLMLATFKEYAPRFRPKVVLWFYFEGNDLWDLQDEKKTGLMPRYLEDGFNQGLLERQTEIDRMLTKHVEAARARKLREQAKGPDRMRDLLEVGKLTTLRTKLGLVYGTDSSEQNRLEQLDANMNLFRRTLEQTKERVSGWGGRLYFIYLPDWSRYSLGTLPGAVGKRAEVFNVVKSLDLPLIDLHPVFQAHPDPLSLFPFRQVGHYKEEGHRLVAETVLKSIFQ
jgi:hypothetical protein